MIVPFLELKATYNELKAEMDAAYRRVMDSGWFILGREVEAFENDYARHVGVRHCIGVANGLEALQLGLLAAGIGKGDEVIVPSHSYIASWLAVSQAGASLVPSEPVEGQYSLDPAQVVARITPRTRAIMPVHLYGHVGDMDALQAIAKKHSLLLLEDGAQSHGALCRGRQSGALSDIAGISFYPSKNLGAFGDAGAVLTSDDAFAEKIRHLRNYGSRVRYLNEYKGMNSRLSELQAAFLRAKLPLLAEWNQRRQRLAGRYHEGLAGVGDLVLHPVPPWSTPVWHLYVIRTRHRDALQAFLNERGIGTQIHYPTPPHLSQAYKDLGWKRGDFPVAERYAEQLLSLPISPHHTASQIDYVIDTIRAFHAR
ncbi:MAG: DegT/DnrJ/EryC1/StrS family aminotransferase [Opitutaceae bacterium]|nr:DegT/DnrJ/EryC1/StrS family aminotransferase [Opitutaceae bacterium]